MGAESVQNIAASFGLDFPPGCSRTISTSPPLPWPGPMRSLPTTAPRPGKVSLARPSSRPPCCKSAAWTTPSGSTGRTPQSQASAQPATGLSDEPRPERRDRSLAFARASQPARDRPPGRGETFPHPGLLRGLDGGLHAPACDRRLFGAESGVEGRRTAVSFPRTCGMP